MPKRLRRGRVMPPKEVGASLALNLPAAAQAARNRLEPQQRTPKLRVTNALGSRTADIWIYDEIGCWGVMAEDLIEALQQVTGADLVIHLNSPGGDYFEGAACYHALLNWPGNVEVRIEGLAASAASFVAMAGDTVIAEPASQLMIHEASGLCWGNSDEMTAMAGVLNKISASIASIYQTRAGGTVDDWRAAMRVESWYSAEEAVAAGLADSVGTPQPLSGEGVLLGEEEEAEHAAAPIEDALKGWPTDAWDLSGFTYPGRDAAPAPVLPTAHAEEAEELAAPESVSAAPEPTETPLTPAVATVEPSPPDGAEDEPEALAAEDTWGALVAHLVAPAPTDKDAWGALVERLLTPAPVNVTGDVLAMEASK